MVEGKRFVDCALNLVRLRAAASGLGDRLRARLSGRLWSLVFG